MVEKKKTQAVASVKKTLVSASKVAAGTSKMGTTVKKATSAKKATPAKKPTAAKKATPARQ